MSICAESTKQEVSSSKYEEEQKAHATSYYFNTPLLHYSATRLIPNPRLAVTDDLPAAGAILEVVFLSEALAAVFVFRLDLHPANRTVVDDERVHMSFPPLRAQCMSGTRNMQE